MKYPLLGFILGICAIAFAYGVAVGKYEVFPYSVLKLGLNSIEQVLADPSSLDLNRPTGFLADIRYQGSGVTKYRETEVGKGVTLLAGFFDNELPEVRLIELDGSVIQSWPVAVQELFADTSHIKPVEDIPVSNWNAAVHGIKLERDGSILFNLDGKGTTKLDRCGNVVWTLSRMTHHSIDTSVDGTYWIPSRYFRETLFANALFDVPYRDDTILHVSAEGEVIEEISLNRILIDNGLYALLVANGAFESRMSEIDVLHINDIEELSPELAPAFPHFDAGDLLLSLRHLNMLVVVQPDGWKVKWYQIGPWHRQHDPDFQPDGSITVFNNNSDDTKTGEILGGSNILRIDPLSPLRTVDVWYDDAVTPGFFTNTQGKHQILPSGNTLIAEYWGGRAFEVNPDGEVVWEYVNRYDEQDVAKISGAVRYPMDYVSDVNWACE